MKSEQKLVAIDHRVVETDDSSYPVQKDKSGEVIFVGPRPNNDNQLIGRPLLMRKLDALAIQASTPDGLYSDDFWEALWRLGAAIFDPRHPDRWEPDEVLTTWLIEKNKSHHDFQTVLENVVRVGESHAFIAGSSSSALEDVDGTNDFISGTSERIRFRMQIETVDEKNGKKLLHFLSLEDSRRQWEEDLEAHQNNASEALKIWLRRLFDRVTPKNTDELDLFSLKPDVVQDRLDVARFLWDQKKLNNQIGPWDLLVAISIGMIENNCMARNAASFSWTASYQNNAGETVSGEWRFAKLPTPSIKHVMRAAPSRRLQ